MRSALMKKRHSEKPKTRLIKLGNPSRSLYAEAISDTRKMIKRSFFCIICSFDKLYQEMVIIAL
jgi:hypothetical protein